MNGVISVFANVTKSVFQMEPVTIITRDAARFASFDLRQFGVNLGVRVISNLALVASLYRDYRTDGHISDRTRGVVLVGLVYDGTSILNRFNSVDSVDSVLAVFSSVTSMCVRAGIAIIYNRYNNRGA